MLTRLIRGLGRIYDFSHVKEFTVEANPGTVTKEWLDTAALLGITRISFGMQAYQENLLILLGRIHSFADVEESVALARTAGIKNISIDLIFGIPGQTQNDWDQTAEAALSLCPAHISAYGLIPEEGTRLYRDLQKKSLSLPEPETEREMYSAFIRKCSKSGFQQYEISNFAKPGYECRHNIGYWTQVPYLGLGVSAASMLGIILDENGMHYFRRTNPDTLRSYENMIRSGFAVPENEMISPREARFETMMLGLRMNRGVCEETFRNSHRRTVVQCYGQKLNQLIEKGLIIHENGFWKLTERGFDVQNSVLVELMDD